MQKILRITTTVITCVVIGYLSGMVTRDSISTWYPTLVKPIFNPPNWIFAPVWSLLYIMMGLAAGMIWNRLELDESNVKKAMKFFVIQLGLNALWSYLFFGLHNPLLALVEIIVLWLMIFETHIQFKKVDKVAANFLLPYLAWVSFATVLNASIWWLNR
jgi:tryptophan-rich sensory protein